MALTAIGEVPQWRWGSWLEQLPNTGNAVNWSKTCRRFRIQIDIKTESQIRIRTIFHFPFRIDLRKMSQVAVHRWPAIGFRSLFSAETLFEPQSISYPHTLANISLASPPPPPTSAFTGFVAGSHSYRHACVTVNPRQPQFTYTHTHAFSWCNIIHLYSKINVAVSLPCVPPPPHNRPHRQSAKRKTLLPPSALHKKLDEGTPV